MEAQIPDLLAWLKNRAWRARGRDAPELAALVVHIARVLDELEYTAHTGTRARWGGNPIKELPQLGAAVRQWTDQFAGEEARAWFQQLNNEVDARLAALPGIIAEREETLQAAVEEDRERRLREAETLVALPDEEASPRTSARRANDASSPDAPAAHAYGDYKLRLNKLIDDHMEKLLAMPSRAKRAEFLADKIGCSKSTAREAVKDRKTPGL